MAHRAFIPTTMRAMPMQVRRSLVAGAVILCALACAPARAFASGSLETTLMDDQELIYSSPTEVAQAMQQIAALGVDRIKVSVVWYLVAPSPTSTQRPNFNAADPNAYPQGAWDRYDLIVRLAQQLGLKVYFQLDPPAPQWAIPAGEPLQNERLGWAPDPTDFQQFVEAVGRRYSGSFVPSSADPPDPNPPTTVTIPGLPTVTVPSSGSSSSSASQPQSPLPRVSYWGVWNEPNLPGWLNPWHNGSELLEPSIYRGLLGAAWNGLQATSHTTQTDTFLIGETANSGPQTPIPFVRSLYCVSANNRMLTGAAASGVGCPTSASRAQFVQANPALFYATGFAHHPYSFNDPPNQPYPLQGWITLQNLPTLEHTLNGILASYGQSRPGGDPIYLTEYGYESNPPNPFVRNSAAQQATWLNESEYMAWRYPYVRSLNQFELADSAPNRAEQKNSYAYWAGTFQTGLEFNSGQPKPAFSAFRVPIWLPVTRHGPSVAIWAQLRPANHAQPQYAVIQFERRGFTRFAQLDELQTTNSEGFLYAHLAIPAPGYVRIAWLQAATGNVYYSRTIAVR
jgi:hypothetical protein